jgi:hypothetical protein
MTTGLMLSRPAAIRCKNTGGVTAAATSITVSDADGVDAGA